MGGMDSAPWSCFRLDSPLFSPWETCGDGVPHRSRQCVRVRRGMGLWAELSLRRPGSTDSPSTGG